MVDASKPEPPPTGDGELVTTALLDWLGECPAADLVRERDAFGREKYGTGLRLHNGRDPAEDLRQDLGDALQYAWHLRAEGARWSDVLALREVALTVVDLLMAYDSRLPWPTSE